MAASFPHHGIGVQTYVFKEQGRFVVYLDVAVAAAGGSGVPFDVVRRRIRDYASQPEAEVAARWIGRGAARDLARPPGGL